MRPKSAKYLEDIRDAAAFIRDVTRGKALDEYRSDRLLRQAVERSFEIIAFRNVLSHGYDVVEPEIVWRVIHDKLPLLWADVENFLTEAEGDG